MERRSGRNESASNDGTSPRLDPVLALKALASPVRLQFMEWLRDPHDAFAAYAPIADRDEYGVCVSHICAKSGLAQSTVSAYLRQLEIAGLVTSHRIGKWTHYRRNDEAMQLLADELSGRQRSQALRTRLPAT